MRTTGLARLIADPELRTAGEDRSVCQMRVMMLERGKSAGLVDIVAWGSLGEHCHRYLLKGREIHIDGVLRMREWTDNDDRRRQAYAVTAHAVDFLRGPCHHSEDDHSPTEPEADGFVPEADLPF